LSSIQATSGRVSQVIRRQNNRGFQTNGTSRRHEARHKRDAPQENPDATNANALSASTPNSSVDANLVSTSAAMSPTTTLLATTFAITRSGRAWEVLAHVSGAAVTTKQLTGTGIVTYTAVVDLSHEFDKWIKDQIKRKTAS
jgi:hypothetical protein